MADAVLVNSAKSATTDTIEVFYTSPPSGAGTRISAFTAANNTESSKTYKAYIYDSAGGLIDAVVPQKIVVRDRFDLAPSIVGQLIPTGGTLRMESSEGDSLSFRVTGQELS